MTLIDQHPCGSFCWVELGTSNQQTGKEFYSALFGWRVLDEPMGPDSYYTMFQIEGRVTAAAYQLAGQEADTPPNWMLYVAVQDLAAAQLVEAQHDLLEEVHRVALVERAHLLLPHVVLEVAQVPIPLS